VFKPAEKKIYLCGPFHNGKWTRMDAGQSKFLGVEKDSMKAYLALMGRADQGRNPSKLPLEQAVLDAVRLEFRSWTFRGRPLNRSGPKNAAAPTVQSQRSPAWGKNKPWLISRMRVVMKKNKSWGSGLVFASDFYN